MTRPSVRQEIHSVKSPIFEPLQPQQKHQITTASTMSSGISIGFKKPAAKKGAPAKPTTKSKKSVFGGDEDDEGSENEIPDEGVFAKKGIKSKKAKDALIKDTVKKKDINRVNTQLATFNELSKKAEEEKAKALQDVDPSVFDYDAAYDAIKEARDMKKKEKEQESEERKPKYIEAFLQSAETRRKDFLRAKEKMLEKEREAEGDEFAGKDVFVTEAYKKQKEELKRLEELEIQREGDFFPFLFATDSTDYLQRRKRRNHRVWSLSIVTCLTNRRRSTKQ